MSHSHMFSQTYSQVLAFDVGKHEINHKWGSVRSMPRGIAYTVDGFNVCLFAQSVGLMSVSPGYAMAEAINSKDLLSWIKDIFGAYNIVELNNRPGQCFKRKWRPGLDGLDNIIQNISPSKNVVSQFGISIEILFERFAEIAKFIDVDSRNLSGFGHKTREILILSCTEVEAAFRAILITQPGAQATNRYTMNDYVRVCDPLCLREFRVDFRQNSNIGPFFPFRNWDPAFPSASLPWYAAYNETKHDRENSLSKATLEMCLQAMAALTVVFCAQFGPPITSDWAHEPAFILNRWFSVELDRPDLATFYVPPVRIIGRKINDLYLFDGRNTAVWQSEDLII